MIDKVLKYIKEKKIFEYGDGVVLGVSGGADSICMLHILWKLEKTLGITLNTVYVNHHIRGMEAQRDGDFVKEFCRSRNIPFTQKDVDVPVLAKRESLSEEEAGRKARYAIFYSLAKEKGASKIAVAHNMNDNSETILFNLFRGTGLKGMLGIPYKRDRIVRPLLCCTRHEIEDYLHSENISYCTDSTNMSTDYRRNKIRLEMIPYVKKNINAGGEYNIVNAAENLEEVYDFLDKEAKKAYDEYVKENTFRKEGFNIHPALQKQIIRMMIEKKAGKLKDITRTHILSVLDLKDKQVSKKINLPYNIVAVRTYQGISMENKYMGDKVILLNIIINKEDLTKGRKNILIEKQNGRHIKITMEVMDKPKDFNVENIKELVYTKWFDYDKIQWLALRTRQPGDYLTVDDGGSKKKLKEYFIDNKIPAKRRSEVLLLADGSHIIWVTGSRISSYYKVTYKTEKVIKVIYHEEE